MTKVREARSAVIAASDVPLWAALFAGLAGVALGTLFALRHERRAEFRTRKLHAADDFLQALTAASAHVAEVRSILGDPEPLVQSEVGVAFRRLEVARDEVLSTLARIDLLFGRGSPTWTSGSSAYQAMHDAVGSLRGLRAGNANAGTLLALHADTFDIAVNGFSAAVRDDLRGAGSELPRRLGSQLRRLQRWLLRLARRLNELGYLLVGWLGEQLNELRYWLGEQPPRLRRWPERVSRWLSQLRLRLKLPR